MEDVHALLIRRGRMGLAIAIPAIVLFLLADLQLHADRFARLFAIRGGLAAAFAVVAYRLAEPPFRDRPAWVLLGTTTALCAATAATAVVIGELAASRMIFVVIVLMTASFLPGGARAQSGAVAAAAASLLWNTLAVSGSGELLEYSNVSTLVAFAVSIYMAHAFESSRREAQARERDLRESEERFRKTFTTVPEAMALSRLRDGVLISVNDGFVRMSEFSAEEAIGRRSTDLGMFVDPAAWAAGVERLRAEGSLVNAEAEFRTKSGKLVTGLASATLVTIAGEPHVVTSVRDVTAQKAAERMRRDLVRMLSHDIKNPLGAAIGFAEILREQLQAGEDPTEALDAIESSSHQALSLAMNFLEADRIESGALELRRSPSAVNQIVADAIRQEAARARRRKVTVRADLAELPSVDLDEPLIERAIGNLVSNAIKFSPEGDEVLVMTALRGASILMEVHDRGPGVAPEDVPRLFQRYARGATVRKDSTGLGLFVVKTIVEAHGGTVDVRCPAEGGSVFAISLPMHPPKAVTPSPPG